METLIRSGHIVDLIFVFMAIEAVGLHLIELPGHRPSKADVFWLLLPGFFLLLALRGALVSWPWEFIAGALVCALVAHLGDLWQRTRSA
jgi:hypothetical protein